MRIKFLKICILLLVAIGLIGLSTPFVSSLNPGRDKENPEVTLHITVNDLREDTPIFNKTKYGPVILLKPSEQTLENLVLLNDHVWNKDSSSYNSEHNFFIYYGLGTLPRKNCITVHQSQEEGSNVEENTWFGGFWEQCGDVNYDYSGRAIKTDRFTIVNSGFKADNLFTPAYEVLSGGRIILKPNKGSHAD